MGQKVDQFVVRVSQCRIQLSRQEDLLSIVGK